MCGRVAIYTHCSTWAERLGAPALVTAGGWDPPPGYDVSPGTWLPIFRRGDRPGFGGFDCAGARWGPYARIQGKWKQLINAKIESLLTSPFWRIAWVQGRRGVLVTDGWYEWDRSTGQRYYLTSRDGRQLVLAAMYGTAPAKREGERTSTMAVVTRPAMTALRPVHERQPLLIPDELLSAWLDPENAPDLARLQKYSNRVRCQYWPVLNQVENPNSQGRELIEPIG